MRSDAEDRTVGASIGSAFHDPNSSLYRRLQVAVGTLIFLALLSLIVDLATTSPEVHAWLMRFDSVLLVLFAVEIALRVASYHPPELDLYDRSRSWRLREHVIGRLRYTLTPLVLLDLVTVAALVPALRGLRALRLLQLLRTLKVFKYSNPVLGILRSFQESSIIYGIRRDALYVVAEILDPENSFHAYAAGANEVIESMRLGFSMMAHSMSTHGSGRVLAQVAATGALNV